MSLKKLPSNNTRRTDSKQAQVLAMLHRKQGATIATMMKATGVRLGCPSLWSAIFGISIRGVSGTGLCSPFFNFHFGGAETGLQTVSAAPGGRRTFYGGVLFMRSVFELRDASFRQVLRRIAG